MTRPTKLGDQTARERLGQFEFIALMGMLFASVAFSIDAMLPALPDIASELASSNPNSAQLIITSFVLGMGFGTLLAGPLSDRFGRRPVIFFGAILYISGAFLAWISSSFELMLLGRVLQGLGAAGPRVVALAIVRDIYEGRQMARIVSFAMLIFTLFPAVAPLIGSWIMAGFGWRAIFLGFVVFSLVSVGWLLIHQPETLPVSERRDLAIRPLATSIREVLAHPVVRLSIAVQATIFAMLYGAIASVQPVFDITFGMAESFPLWFGALALISAIPSLVNAAIVVRLGMRRLIYLALISQCVFSTLALGSMAVLPDGADAQFWTYFLWLITLFGMLGFTLGNLNALALQPMGHIAGTAASTMSAVSTLLGGAIGAPLGIAFDGTPIPLAAGTLALCVLSVFFMTRMPKGDV